MKGSGDMTNPAFVLDISKSHDGIVLWTIQNGSLTRKEHTLKPSFMVAFTDPHLHYQLIEGLESMYEVVPCTIQSIYGEETGYTIYAGREIAEKIEGQTRHQARLYNVDIRSEQRFCSTAQIVPGGWIGGERLVLDLEIPTNIMEITCSEDPYRTYHPGVITMKTAGQKSILKGPDRQIVDDMMDIIGSVDPDIILFPDYDAWSPLFNHLTTEWGIMNTLSRTGHFSTLKSRSYFSYGRMEHRTGAEIPEGRIIIDTRQSFMYRNGDCRGVFLASRLTGLSPNLTSRLTPGTIVSGYEVYEALVRGIAVPFRKSDAEAHRNLRDMRLDYRGGYMLQPVPGIYANVIQIDFTSFYPSIIVKYNLSPETLADSDRDGFLPSVLQPLLILRQGAKKLKKKDSRYQGMDSILKWMLVTCFGYTGYKNARFGRIEVHEQITQHACDILKECISMVEETGGRVIHAIIDCLFIEGTEGIKAQTTLETMTGFHTECEYYDWVVILPQADGSGSYGSYYGRLTSGEVKIRGVASRRTDMPAYVKRMQQEMIACMATCPDIRDIPLVQPQIHNIYHRFFDTIHEADLTDLVITRRIGRDRYHKRCIAQAVIDRYRQDGVVIRPGMNASYLVRDEKHYQIDPSWDLTSCDVTYYRRLLDRAYEEVKFALSESGG